jgi:LuxR family maltose regulon positive regulatory protein
MAAVRAAAVDDGAGQAVIHGHRAVELAQSSVDEMLVGASAGLARALYVSGDLPGARRAALRAIDHPDASRRAPGYAVAQAVLAVVAADQGRLTSARDHAETAREIVARITSSRSWLGASVAEALGAVLAAEGDLPGAERELSYAERFLAQDGASLPHAQVIVRLADVRCRRGRLDEAQETLGRARDQLSELRDSGGVARFAAQVADALHQARGRARSGEFRELPSEAELAVLRLLGSDLSAREIGAQLYLSPNTVRSHIRSIYRKLGVGSRENAVARAETIGLVGGKQSPR